MIVLKVAKKRVTADAVLMDGTEATAVDITKNYPDLQLEYVPAKPKEDPAYNPDEVVFSGNMFVSSPKGTIVVKAGEYIMTGPDGKRYPLTPERFSEIYDIEARFLDGVECGPES